MTSGDKSENNFHLGKSYLNLLQDVCIMCGFLSIIFSKHSIALSSEKMI